jgi:hypothetical protein
MRSQTVQFDGFLQKPVSFDQSKYDMWHYNFYKKTRVYFFGMYDLELRFLTV